MAHPMDVPIPYLGNDGGFRLCADGREEAGEDAARPRAALDVFTDGNSAPTKFTYRQLPSLGGIAGCDTRRLGRFFFSSSRN